MNEVLGGFIGQRVKVWSGDQGLSDEGILEEYEHPWLRMRKVDGSTLCFSAYTVRLIRMLDRGEEDSHVVSA